jgi:hypothetical protein
MGQYMAYVKTLKEVELTCMGCGEMFIGAQPKMCCNGNDCGCQGQPVDPIVCSEECYNKLIGNQNKTQ